MKFEGKLLFALLGFGGFLVVFLFWENSYKMSMGSYALVILYMLFAFGLHRMIKVHSKSNIDESSSLPDTVSESYDESGKPKRPPEVITLSNRIFSILSHEIRTPVTAIASSTQVLRQGGENLSEERRDIHFNNIKLGLDRIQSLIDGVTLVTQSEQGKLPFDPQSIELEVLCESTIDQLEAHKETDRIKLSFDQEVPNPVKLDENLLRHMLYNLLSNALKYSGQQATVDFAVDKRDEFIEITITDKGIGIPIEDHGHLFESFYRASNVSGIPGTGLGLNIAKRAVEAHGGTISYESKEGVGSVFMICLPLA